MGKEGLKNGKLHLHFRPFLRHLGQPDEYLDYQGRRFKVIAVREFPKSRLRRHPEGAYTYTVKPITPTTKL